jgi:Tol biopolymer transport system component
VGVNGNTLSPHAISSGPFDVQPSFSPDGTQIVFNRNYQIWVMDAGAGGSPRSLQTISPLSGFNEWPHWSVNDQIVFHSTDTGFYQIYVMAAPTSPTTGGENLVQVTSDTPTPTHNNAWPVWGPQGERIAFDSDRLLSGTSQIYRMTPTPGANEVLVTGANSPTITSNFPSWACHY